MHITNSKINNQEDAMLKVSSNYVYKHIRGLADDAYRASHRQVRSEVARAATANARGVNEKSDDRPVILPIVKKMLGKKASVFSKKDNRKFFKRYSDGIKYLKRKSNKK